MCVLAIKLLSRRSSRAAEYGIGHSKFNTKVALIPCPIQNNKLDENCCCCCGYIGIVILVRFRHWIFKCCSCVHANATLHDRIHCVAAVAAAGADVNGSTVVAAVAAAFIIHRCASIVCLLLVSFLPVSIVTAFSSFIQCNIEQKQLAATDC